MLATEQELLVDRCGIVDELEDSPFSALVDLLEESLIDSGRILDGWGHGSVDVPSSVKPANHRGPIIILSAKVEHQIADKGFDLDRSQPPLSEL